MIKYRMGYLFLLIVLVACTNPESPGESISEVNPATSTPIVSVQILEDLKAEAIDQSTEVIAQNNCGGNAEVESLVERSMSITRIIEAGAGLEVNANGQVGLLGTDVELGATVASRLGYSYGSTEEVTRSITVKAMPSTKMEHHISLQEIWEVGSAKIMVGNDDTTIPFRFRKSFSLELIDSVDLGCPSPLPTALPQPTHTPLPTPIPITDTPSSTPFPTNTATPTSTHSPTSLPTDTPTATPTSQSGLVLVGDIKEITPPPSVNPGDYEDSKSIVIFREVQQFTLISPITVDVSEPGTYNSRDERTPDIIPAGTIIDSYFIHLDPIGTSPQVDLNGTITFDTRIIGVILLADQLNSSDLIIAIGTNTKYPTGGVDRRFEFGDDRLVVSEDMKTINIELIAGNSRDQIRVITESSSP